MIFICASIVRLWVVINVVYFYQIQNMNEGDNEGDRWSLIPKFFIIVTYF